MHSFYLISFILSKHRKVPAFPDPNIPIHSSHVKYMATGQVTFVSFQGSR